MGYCDRTAGFNLFSEQRNDGAVTSQYVSEADCYELCLCVFQGVYYFRCIDHV